MNEEYEVRKGDIFYIARLGDTTGCEQTAGRPAVIVSNDKNNKYSPTVEIVYCTTKPKEGLPTHRTIKSTKFASTVLCEQITTVDKQRLGDYIGRCTDEEMESIDIAMCISLGLEPPKEEMVSVRTSALVALKKECDVYKDLYEQMLNRYLPTVNEEK